MRLAVPAAIWGLLAMGSAAACEGQLGSTVFEDHFADDEGGWDITMENVAIVPPAMKLTLSPDQGQARSLNQLFKASQGDYCVDFVLPAAPEGSNLTMSLEFWGSDTLNTMDVVVNTNGELGLFNRTNGSWQTIWLMKDVPGISFGGANSLRAVVANGKIAVYLNGSLIKTVRSQPASSPLKFGVYVEAYPNVPSPVDMVVTGFRVSSGP